MALCFDTTRPSPKRPNVHKTDFADYKANRQKRPEEILSLQFPDKSRGSLKGMNISPVIRKQIDGYEADDGPRAH